MSINVDITHIANTTSDLRRHALLCPAISIKSA